MKGPKLENIDRDKFSERMHSESDRACAILGAALLDAKLEELFSNRLRKFAHELLNGTGAVSTFSSRICLANALAWIPDSVQTDLDTIRGIRNDFAHSFDHELSFDNQSIKDRCSNLVVAKSYLAGFDEAMDRPGQKLSKHAITSIKTKFSAPRRRFQLAVDFISQYLDELPASTLKFEEDEFLSEVFNLSAGFAIQVSGVISVESKDQDGTQSK